MKKLLALLVLLASPLYAAVETTTVTGKVYLPSGSVATSGTVSAALSAAATTPDGAGSSVVASRVSASIGSDGTVSLTLVPNDAMSPEGTYYYISYSVKTPTPGSWSEKWTVVTAPDPIQIGAVTRVDTPPGIAAPVSTVQDEGTDLSKRTRLNFIGSGVTCVDSAANGRTNCTITGSGTPGGSTGQVQGNNSGSFGGIAGSSFDSNGVVGFNAITAQGSVHAYDYSGDGIDDTVPANVSALIQARAHASIYSPQPELYLEGGIVDVWTDIAHNKGPADLAQSAEFSQTILQCDSGGSCTNATILCTTATSLFAVGDTFLTGNTRTHIVQAVATGGGTNCPASPANNQVTFSPPILADESLSAGGTIKSLWQNSSHFSTAGFNLLGYKIGTSPLARDGKHGPDALTNGAADYGTPLKDWEVVGTATTGANSWQATPTTNAFDCVEGTIASSCFYMTGGGSSDILRTPKYPRAIDVRPGERWILSGYVTLQGGTFSVALESDINRDGTLETYVPVSSAQGAPYNTTPAWFWATFTIPSGVHQVRIRFTRSGTNTLQVDGFPFRRAALLADDTTSTAPVSYLVNDPGSRSIVVTGDSWGAASGGTGRGDYVAAGLAAALLARTGRDLSAQIIPSGKGGITVNGMLTSNLCTTTSGSGGALNCWYDSIEQYHPLYVVVMLGTNDVFAGTPSTASVFTAYIQRLRARIRSIGAIPIIVGVAPVGGNFTQYNVAHGYADLERKEILDSGFGATTIASGFEAATQSSTTAAPVITSPLGTGDLLLSTQLDTFAEWRTQVGVTGTCNSTTYVRADGTCNSPAGAGDVVGPAASLDNELAAFDSTTGKLLKQSGVTKSGADYTFPGSVGSTCTAASGDCGLQMTDDTTEPSAPGSGTFVYTLGGELYKKDSGDSTNERLFFNTGNIVNPVTWITAGTTCTSACSTAFNRGCTDAYPGAGGAAVGCASTTGVRTCWCS